MDVGPAISWLRQGGKKKKREGVAFTVSSLIGRGRRKKVKSLEREDNPPPLDRKKKKGGGGEKIPNL